jgi:hypothetical protein
VSGSIAKRSLDYLVTHVLLVIIRLGLLGGSMSSAVVNGLAGAGGGIIAQIITYPLQTVPPSHFPFSHSD